MSQARSIAPSESELQDLSAALGEQLRQRGLTLAVAESCTGGLLAGTIVAIPGSSDYFLGGVVAYANEVKSGILGVAPATLAAHGAVSWQAAAEMAWGALALLGANLALSTTGIAGPAGGTPDKPVGTVYIALSTRERILWQRHQWAGPRLENIRSSVGAALKLLEAHLTHAEQEAAESGSLTPAQLADHDEVVQVELRGGQGGRAVPTAFTWRGQRHIIESHGRSWRDAEGAWHYLVMSQGHGTFQLDRDPAGRWRVGRAWPRPLPA